MLQEDGRGFGAEQENGLREVQTRWHEQDIGLESRDHEWDQVGDGEENWTYTEELLLNLSDQHNINRFREMNEEEPMAVVHKAFENVRPRVPPPRFGERRQHAHPHLPILGTQDQDGQHGPGYCLGQDESTSRTYCTKS